MKKPDEISGYRYSNSNASCAHSYLLPAIRAELKRLIGEQRAESREQRAESREQNYLFDLGCGNGSVGAVLDGDGWDVTGVDPSDEGIAEARKNFPDMKFEKGSAYDDLAKRFGSFPVVISLEVVEHVYAPRTYARTLFNLLEPGGTAIISTPYHSYLKNLTLAATGKMDAHFTALWDHGHIKFWSYGTLSMLLVEAGFSRPRFLRVGRIPALAKSMIAIVKKPEK